MGRIDQYVRAKTRPAFRHDRIVWRATLERELVLRWLVPVVAAALLAADAVAQGRWEPSAPAGYLIVAGSSPDMQFRPYEPKPGDIVLYDDLNPFFHFLFRCARTRPPTHVAMVVERDDGTPALLDLLGPTVLSAHVAIVDIPQRLRSYAGSIMVRRLREPLTPEQRAELWHFAVAQEGKEFAAKRVVLLATPFCARIGLRRYCFARTHFDRSRWFCSELVAAAAGAAHILDPHDYPANAICPHDLACDDWLDLSHRYEPAVPWVGDPMALTAPN
jgi:hypothetical protein